MARSPAIISAVSNYALRSPLGSLVNGPRNAAKEALGLYFDLFVKTYRTGGMAFEIPQHLTSRGLRGKFVSDTYELPERTLIARHLPTSARVLELGGSIGVVSCVINKRLSDPSRHVVLEPNSQLIEWLTRNRDANSCRFAIENKIVSDAGTVYLQTSENSDSGRVSSEAGGEGTAVVETITWSELERAHGFQFDTLICDIEGAEHGLLTAFADDVSSLQTIIIEMHPRIVGAVKQAEIDRLLSGSGFRCIDGMLDTQVWTKV